MWCGSRGAPRGRDWRRMLDNIFSVMKPLHMPTVPTLQASHQDFRLDFSWSSCKQCTAHRTCHSRKHFFACGSSGAHAPHFSLFCVISQNSHLHRHISCRTRIVHGLTAFFFHFRTALRLCFHPLKWSISCNPQHGVQFAEQSPITGYEPNDLVEDSSTEVATMFQPSRRASVGSTYNSGEDIATTLASSDLG